MNQKVARARDVLANPTATKDQKSLAAQVLLNAGWKPETIFTVARRGAKTRGPAGPRVVNSMNSVRKAEWLVCGAKLSFYLLWQ